MPFNDGLDHLFGDENVKCMTWAEFNLLDNFKTICLDITLLMDKHGVPKYCPVTAKDLTLIERVEWLAKHRQIEAATWIKEGTTYQIASQAKDGAA